MKKLLTFALSLGVLLTSCNKSQTPSASSIEGKWQMQKEVAVLSADGKVVTEESYDATSIDNLGFYFEFNADKTFTALGYFPGESDVAGGGTYSILNDRLVLTYKEGTLQETVSYIIDSLTSSQLILKLEEDTYEEDGIQFVVSVLLYFNKVN